jgi:hypothetical protein
MLLPLMPMLVGLLAVDTPGGLNLKVSRTGVIEQVLVSGAHAAGPIFILIPKRDWKGNYGDQQALRPSEVTITTEGGTRRIVGFFPADGAPIRFEESITAAEGAVQIRCRLVPSADLDTPGPFLILRLPCETYAGRGRWYRGTGPLLESREVPAELPPAYHLDYAKDTDWFGLATPEFGLSGAISTGRAEVSLQDDRQFGIQSFEIQVRMADRARLLAGVPVESALRLEAADPAALERERQVWLDRQRASRLRFGDDRPLAIGDVHAERESVPRYGKFEATFDLAAQYDNPFDPEDIDVVAVFVAPSGRAVRVPAFLYQEYERSLLGGTETLTPVGKPVWKVRFAPTEPGAYRYWIEARDRSGSQRSEAQRFEVVDTGSRGFIRRSERSPWYLRFDTGGSYFPVGENLAWVHERGLYDYEQWLPALGGAGGDFARVWLVPWNFGLEWTDMQGWPARGQFYGLGRYSLDNAWKVDRLLDLAERHGVYLMLCLGTYGELLQQRGHFDEQLWQWSPYNAANGGPCQSPADFWTSEEARRLYKQRLRYLAARYGYSTHIQSWELWNEVNAPAEWVAEMAAYLKRTDPNRHLVTTTYGDRDVWAVPEVDFAQAHMYGSPRGPEDAAERVVRLAADNARAFGKPFLIGEFGIDWTTGDGSHDPQGLGTNMHNGIWAAMASGTMGSAMMWYYSYVHAKNLYREFTALKAFVRDIPWSDLDPSPVATTLPESDSAPSRWYEDLVLVPPILWGKASGTLLRVNPDGAVEGGTFAGTLYSQSKPDLRAPPTFLVTYPAPGKFIVHVGRVAAGGVLRIWVDDTEVLTEKLPAGEGAGHWRESRFLDQWNIWEATYDRDFAVEVPAGRHAIRVDNTGADWVSVDRYVFTGCRETRFRVLGLRDEGLVLLWIHDPKSTWFNDQAGLQPRDLVGLRFAVLDLPDGDYEVEWWDTRMGQVTAKERVTSRGGRLRLRAPTFRRDIACKIRRR